MISKRFVTLALIAAAGIMLQAGDFSASLRGGLGLGKKDGVKDMLGFGLGYTFEIAQDSSVVTELSYFYQPGTNQRVGIAAPVTLGDSVNFQKLTATGIGIRGLYRQKLAGEWSWQAGLYVAQAKSRMDAIGDIRSDDDAQIGGWAFNPEKTSLSVNPVVGLSRDLGDLGTFEMNLSTLRYSQVTVTPTWVAGGTGVNTVKPGVGEKTVSHLNLEFGVAFRF